MSAMKKMDLIWYLNGNMNESLSTLTCVAEFCLRADSVTAGKTGSEANIAGLQSSDKWRNQVYKASQCQVSFFGSYTPGRLHPPHFDGRWTRVLRGTRRKILSWRWISTGLCCTNSCIRNHMSTVYLFIKFPLSCLLSFLVAWPLQPCCCCCWSW